MTRRQAALPSLDQGKVLQIAALVAPAVIVGVMAASKAWTFDDGFIYYRTVEQLLAGNGPVFNAGQRVETFTSPLWLLALTLGDIVVPMRLEYLSAALSIAASAGGIGLATRASTTLVRSGESGRVAVVPLGSLVLASLWPVWVWTTSGLEVGLTFCWIGSCALVLARWAIRSGTSTSDLPMPRSWLILIGLGWLVRPELVLSSVAFVVLVAVRSKVRRRVLARTVAWSVAVPLGYQIFRMGYYGSLVSSPAIAKEGSRANPGAGWAYLSDFVTPYVLAIPVTAIALGVAVPLVRRLVGGGLVDAALVAIVVSGSGVVHAASVVFVGGDYVHARLLLPAIFAFLAPWFVISLPSLRQRPEAGLVIGAWCVLALVVLRPGVDTRQGLVIGEGYLGRYLTHEDHGFEQRGSDQPWMSGPGLYIADVIGNNAQRTNIAVADDETIVAGYAIGVLGYSVGPDVRIVDLLGLAEPVAAHERLQFRLIPGHEKVLSPVWAAARLAEDPSTVLPGDFPADAPFRYVPDGLEFMEGVAWASAALECGALANVIGASEEPLTAGQFTRNLASAMSNSVMRIDSNPQVAYTELCDSDERPRQVEEFLDRGRVVDELPVVSSRGDLAIAGKCAVVFVGTGDEESPWMTLEGSSMGAVVALDAAERAPDLAALWVLRPFGDWQAVAWIETDGDGNYRTRLDIDWFPPAFQPWTEIPADGHVDIQLIADPSASTWALSADGQFVSTTQLVGDLTPILPVAANPSDATISIEIEHAEPVVSPICEEMISP